MQSAEETSPTRVTYARASHAARRATFDDGESVEVTGGRVRTYPGLPSEAPPTLPFYVLAAVEVAEGARVLDVGCGTGTGTRLLKSKATHAFGVDVSEEAAVFARHCAGGAEIHRADACEALPEIEIDAAVFIDVLAHMIAPFDALTAVHARLPASGRIFVAEPSAHPEQYLRAPVRRAFSERALEALLGAAGFAIEKWHSAGTFLACTARKIDDAGALALVAATRASDPSAALSLYDEAKKSTNALVRLEAALATADLYVAFGKGDAACNELFEAKALAPNDPRPVLGLARVALLTRDHANARVLSDVAVSLDPSEAAAHAMNAIAREEAGESSLHSWRMAVNLAPDAIAYVDKLVSAAAASDAPKLAVHAAERLRAYGITTDARIVYANALKADGRETDARYELEIVSAEGLVR